MELSATQLLLFLLPFTSCKQSLQRFKDSKNQVRTSLSLSLSLSFYYFSSSSHTFFLGFSSVVAIESMRKKEQAWHVDTPVPHVIVNLFYLSDGQPLTQFLRPVSALPVDSFAELQEQLLSTPFDPMSSNGVAEVWRYYLQERFAIIFFLLFLLLSF
jgi:hypothetical protein